MISGRSRARRPQTSQRILSDVFPTDALLTSITGIRGNLVRLRHPQKSFGIGCVVTRGQVGRCGPAGAERRMPPFGSRDGRGCPDKVPRVIRRSKIDEGANFRVDLNLSLSSPPLPLSPLSSSLPPPLSLEPRLSPSSLSLLLHLSLPTMSDDEQHNHNFEQVRTTLPLACRSRS